MAEEAKVWMPQSPMEEDGRPDDNVGPKHSCSSPKDVGNNQNVCTVQEDDSDVLAPSKKNPMQTKRAKKGGGYNLRKSIAWNQAFFVEEGVLNPLELSMLSGSFTKSSGSILSGNDGEMAPQMEYQSFGGRNDVEVNISNKSQTKSETKDFKGGKLFSNSEALIKGEQQPHASGKMHSAKSIVKIVPRPPASISQKRVANTHATNPTSKLPKFVPTRSHASSLPMTSRNVISTPISFKSNHTTRVNVDHGIGAKGFSSNTRKESGCLPSSTKSSSHDRGKHLAPQAEKDSTGFKMNPQPSGSGMVSSSRTQNVHQVSQGPPLPARAKPSALRLPSPSLGFFRQGKVSPSYGNHSQRNIQQPMPSIPPLRKTISLKQPDELRPAPSTGQECTEDPVATESCARNVVVGSLQASSAANSRSCSTATVDTHPSTKEKIGMEKMDMMNKTTSGILYCQTSGQDQLGSSCFSVDDNIDKLPHVFSVGKLNHHEDNLMLQIDPKSSVEESGLHSENSNDAYPSTVKSSENKLSSSNFSSRISPKKLEGSESKQLHEGDSGDDNLGKYLHVGDLGDESSSLLSKDKQSAGNSDFISNLGFGFTARNADFAASLKTGSSLKLSKEQMAGANISHSTDLDCSLDQKTGAYVPIIDHGSIRLASGLSSTLSEESQSAFSKDRKIQDCQAQSAVKTDLDCSLDQKTGAYVPIIDHGSIHLASGLSSTLSEESHSTDLDCSLDQKTGAYVPIIDHGSIRLASGLSSTLSEESQSAFSKDRKIQDCQAQSDVKKQMDSIEDREFMQDKGKLTDRLKLDLVPPRHQAHAVPFSDEWLAALEAFGEEILELKTGPVQNSPPDNAIPEPSPWSPVKRKAKDIGPYDCTKYLKNPSTPESH